MNNFEEKIEMTNADLLTFRKVLISTVLGVVVTAIMTATAFYYSAQESLKTLKERQDQHDRMLNQKLDASIFQDFQTRCAMKDAQIERRLERMDDKLDRLIEFQMRRPS